MDFLFVAKNIMAIAPTAPALTAPWIGFGASACDSSVKKKSYRARIRSATFHNECCLWCQGIKFVPFLANDLITRPKKILQLKKIIEVEQQWCCVPEQCLPLANITQEIDIPKSIIQIHF